MTVRGGWRVLTVAVRRLVNVETLLWCVGDLRPEPAAEDPGWMRLATTADERALARLSGGRRTMRKRLARGDRAVVAEREDELVACVWITTRPLRLPRYGLSVGASPEVPYSYALQVVPKARRQGVGTALAYYIRDVEGPRLGFRHMSYHISPRNPATYRRHVAATDARTIGELRVLVLFGVFPHVIRSRVRPGAPALAR